MWSCSNKIKNCGYITDKIEENEDCKKCKNVKNISYKYYVF